MADGDTNSKIEKRLGMSSSHVISSLSGQSKGTVMIVDDEELIVELLCDILTMEGFDVVPVQNPLDALEAFKSHSPQIIFSDLTMPKLNGVDLLQQIRALNQKVEVYFVTGNITHEAQTLIDSRQVNGVIEKPFKVPEIISLCQGACQRK